MSVAPVRSADRVFEEVFAAKPEGVWSAPGRVNLIGDFTDINDGFVLPIALPLRTTVAVSRSNEPRLRIASVMGGSVELAELSLTTPNALPEQQWASYLAGVAWSLRDAGSDVVGADVAITSDVPIGAGLSSSAALESAFVLALNDLYDFDLERPELARIARRAENEYIGVPSGIMDQTASLCGVRGQALFLDTRSEELEFVPFDPAAFGLTLLIIDTHVRHALASSAYGDRVRECQEAASLLGVHSLRDAHLVDLERAELLPETIRRRARHVVTENQRVLDVVDLLRSGDISQIGPTLSRSHVSLRDDFEVSCEELDIAVEAALESGALGARMTGGGFGGCAICLVRERDAEAVGQVVIDAFSQRRLVLPRWSVAAASGGAERQR
jgi:galactokinase